MERISRISLNEIFGPQGGPGAYLREDNGELIRLFLRPERESGRPFAIEAENPIAVHKISSDPELRVERVREIAKGHDLKCGC